MPNVSPEEAGQNRSSGLAELYRRLAPLVNARARRILGEDAEDVVQEVFLRFVANPPVAILEAGDSGGCLETPEHKTRITAWLYTITTNLCLDRIRASCRRNADWYKSVKLTLSGVSSPADQLERVLENRELCQRILARADKKTQQIAVLTYSDEMNQQEIADLLGISRKTVNERLSRFQRLARKLVKRWQSLDT